MKDHNPGNWHTVIKPADKWAEEYLNKSLTVSADEGGVSVKVDKVLSIDYDLEPLVKNSRNKVTTLYDIKLSLEYSGKTKDAEDVTGTISIPEVSQDMEVDEYVFEIANNADASSKQPVKDLVRSKIIPQLREAFSQMTAACIRENSERVQLSADEQIFASNAFPKVPVYPQTGKKAAAPSTSTTTTTTSGKVAINTTIVTASDEFRTTAQELYNTFTDPQRISAFTRGAPRLFEGATPGGKFAIFDGNVTGEFVKLDAPKQIIQKWRLAQWPAEHYSTQKINFDQNDVDGVTQMRVEWSGVPVGQEDVTKQNWDMYYVRSIKQTFGFGTIL